MHMPPGMSSSSANFDENLCIGLCSQLGENADVNLELKTSCRRDVDGRARRCFSGRLEGEASLRALLPARAVQGRPKSPPRPPLSWRPWSRNPWQKSVSQGSAPQTQPAVRCTLAGQLVTNQ